MGSVAAERYATALYEVAEKENTQDSILAELKEISKCFVEFPDLLKILSAPFISKPERLETIKVVFKDMLSQNSLNFIMLLTENGRIVEFQSILAEYISIYNKKHNICTALVTSAIVLSDETNNALAKKLSVVTGKKVVINSKVDPSILGGLIVDIEGERMDSSVRSKIDEISKSITKSIA